jgi:hypothetical protein
MIPSMVEEQIKAEIRRLTEAVFSKDALSLLAPACFHGRASPAPSCV